MPQEGFELMQGIDADSEMFGVEVMRLKTICEKINDLEIGHCGLEVEEVAQSMTIAEALISDLKDCVKSLAKAREAISIQAGIELESKTRQVKLSDLPDNVKEDVEFLRSLNAKVEFHPGDQEFIPYEHEGDVAQSSTEEKENGGNKE